MGCNSSHLPESSLTTKADPNAPPPPPLGSKIYQQSKASSISSLAANWDSLKADVDGLLYQCPVTGKTTLIELLLTASRGDKEAASWAFTVFKEALAKRPEESFATLGMFDTCLLPIHLSYVALSVPGFVHALVASNPDLKRETILWNPVLDKPCDPMTAYELVLLYGYRYAPDSMDVACALELLDYEGNACKNTPAYREPSISEILSLAMEGDNGELYDTIKKRLTSDDASEQILRLDDKGVNAFHTCFVENMGEGKNLPLAKQMFSICSHTETLTAEDILGPRQASSSVFDRAKMRGSLIMNQDTSVASPVIEKNIAGMVDESTGNYPLHLSYLTDDLQFIIDLRDRYPEALKKKNKAGLTPYSMAKAIEHRIFDKHTTASLLEILDFSKNAEKISRHDNLENNKNKV
ncbi:hypothetical protein TrVE_jg10522 [Triparma verrucosa]|uniref:Uncharacterized protein n=1 Tax=Triparma verrucosa TaxID=1606542 RepID=A0A9W7FLT9_9STRA|nr:hypothetical protein TrVE_jg10522 [Triparma verrucosa]